MASQQEHLENLSEIRNIMERSSRFISLSGLSGVFAGSLALVGAGFALWWFHGNLYVENHNSHVFFADNTINYNHLLIFTAIGAAVLLPSLGFGIYFTTKKARSKGLPVWDSTAKRLVLNLLIPLATGGIFCLILLYRRDVQLIAPATLLFYGLALINASKYTLNDIRYLGITEIILGLVAAMYAGYGLLFWIIGFGVMHIVYGIVMYRKYER